MPRIQPYEGYNRQKYDFGFDEVSDQAIKQEIDHLMKEEEMSYEQAAFVAAATMDGAGELATVHSIQTCTDIGGNPIPSLSGPDAVVCRLDEHSATAQKRRRAAEEGIDDAAHWIKEHSPQVYAELYAEE